MALSSANPGHHTLITITKAIKLKVPDKKYLVESSEKEEIEEKGFSWIKDRFWSWVTGIVQKNHKNLNINCKHSAKML